MDGISASVCDDESKTVIDLPEDILNEGEKIKREIEQEEKEKESNCVESEQATSNDEQAALHEIKFKRLMHLLDRSKFYANFLLQRMASKKEEEKLKQEKLAKKEAGKKNMLQKENETASVAATDGPDADNKRSSRKRPLAAETVSSPPDNGEASRLIKPKKRSRKQNLSEANILNIIDEEELKKRAAKGEEGNASDEEKHETGPDKNEENISDLFEGVMRPYQIDGFRWLVSLYENGMNGILADEMGLGKTAHLMSKGVTGPFLVCAPLSTLPNWMSELKRFTPKIPTVLFHGNQEKRDALLLEIKQKFKIDGVHGVKFFPVVVTSFEVVIRDRKVLERLQWRYIIVDEGHRLKNFQCRLVQELKKYPSSNRLLLTGTPLQNNLSELWSLLNFLLPEIFDDLDVFTAWFRVEEFQNSEAEHKVAELERKESVLSMLHQILSPFLLRRLKTDVDLDIPLKKELLVYCPMSKLQEELYRATVDHSIAFLLGLETNSKEEKIEYDARGRPKRQAKRENINYAAMVGNEVTEELKKTAADDVDKEIDEWMKLSDDLQWAPREACKRGPKCDDVKMQNPMMQLRKIVNHPYLVKWELDPETGDYVLNEDMVRDSGKLSVMDQMLKRLIKDGHKVLVFSQLTMMLDVLADYLCFRGMKFSRLDGRMNLEDRAIDMETFRTDPDTSVFLVSTRAGGLGVNLTSADTVIIYDSDWNPQCDLQAQDRCHRIGQTKPVVVYRLVTSDTIDQRIIDRAGAKRKLEKLVIQKGKFKSGVQINSAAMSVQELMELLNSRDHNGIWRGNVSTTGQVFTEQELDALMDRSDLVNGCTSSNEVSGMSGVFKRLDVVADEMKK